METLKKFDESDIRETTCHYTLAALIRSGDAFDGTAIDLEDGVIGPETHDRLLDHLDHINPISSNPKGLVSVNGLLASADGTDHPEGGAVAAATAIYRAYALLLKRGAERDDRLYLLDRYELVAPTAQGVVVDVNGHRVHFLPEGTAWRAYTDGVAIPPTDAAPWSDISELCDEVEAQLQ